MITEIVTFKSEKWGVIPHRDHEGHFYTGWVGKWTRYYDSKNTDTPHDRMELGRNAVIDGRFVIESMSRGRSAANFHGHFLHHEDVKYELSMSGITLLLQLLQSGHIQVVDDAFMGKWTFAKQGQDIFLTPAKPQ